jgi:drug/metabolite transporter (DMT)-like permease
MRARDRAGLAFAALCALDAAFAPGLAKLTTGGAGSGFVAAVTIASAAVAALAYAAVRGELAGPWRGAVLLRLAALGAIGTALPMLLYFEGTRRGSATLAALCQQAEPVYSLALAWLVLGHRPTPGRWLAIALIAGGIALALGAGEVPSPSSAALLLAAPIAWQLSHLIALRGLEGTPVSVLTAGRYGFGALWIAAAWLLRADAPRLPDADALRALAPMLVLQGVVTYWLGTLLWYETITRLDLARATAIIVPSVPLLAIGASFLLVREVPSPPQLGGFALAAAGVATFVLSRDASSRGVAP